MEHISSKDIIAQNSRLLAFKEIRRTINKSKPEFHICQNCAADVAYTKGGKHNSNPGLAWY